MDGKLMRRISGLAHVHSSAPVQGVVRLLLANGASPDIADNDNVTPMDVLRVKSTRLTAADKLADLLEQHRKPAQTKSGECRELTRWLSPWHVCSAGMMALLTRHGPIRLKYAISLAGLLYLIRY